MSTGDQIAAFQQIMLAEAETVRRFVALLALEQASLGSGNTDELPAFAEQKVDLAAQLNAFAAQRNSALAAQGFGADRSGVEAWCAQHPDQEITAGAWSSILAQAREARELNQLNGKLIQLRMQYNAKALEALRGGNGALDLYGPDGQSKPPGHRRINHSV